MGHMEHKTSNPSQSISPNCPHTVSSKHEAFFLQEACLYNLFKILADATANYAVAFISSNQSNDLSDDDCDLLAFWSPFLLVTTSMILTLMVGHHFDGLDTITALALEDNELWLRHFLTLVFQAVATLYVFLQSLTENKLMIPMILMFVSGCIKYLERTRSLYLASIVRFRDSMLKEPDAGPNYAKLMEEHASKELTKLPTQIIMNLTGNDFLVFLSRGGLMICSWFMKPTGC